MSYSDLQIGRYSQVNQVYFITTVLYGRKPLFNDYFCARKVVYEMRSIHTKGLVNSLAWVVMPDHLHWLFRLNEISSLSTVMKQFKAHTAHSINHYLNRHGTVWQKAYYDHALRQEEDIKQVARYIVANPLRAKMVENIGEYAL